MDVDKIRELKPSVVKPRPTKTWDKTRGTMECNEKATKWGELVERNGKMGYFSWVLRFFIFVFEFFVFVFCFLFLVVSMINMIKMGHMTS